MALYLLLDFTQISCIGCLDFRNTTLRAENLITFAGTLRCVLEAGEACGVRNGLANERSLLSKLLLQNHWDRAFRCSTRNSACCRAMTSERSDFVIGASIQVVLNNRILAYFLVEKMLLACMKKFYSVVWEQAVYRVSSLHAELDNSSLFAYRACRYIVKKPPTAYRLSSYRPPLFFYYFSSTLFCLCRSQPSVGNDQVTFF